ncbi:MAG TPA: methylmalonyl Co-A mutase-associated GTPase MeaB [Gemmatimonadales bacterium]|nr:methylmalonyl Co-A mutase-associated GTPase MeaB [Gemmatimonadales bacterium]
MSTPADEQPRIRRAALSLEDYVAGINAGDRSVLGRALTLVESTAERDRELAAALLSALMPLTGGSVRLGLTGTPGVGKSTFIETLGSNLVERGHKVAVLAIDPSSTVSGGSILGDKTRMPRLSTNPSAFIRPSPSIGTLGGIAARTREALLVCEAAGFDVVLVETVGVGQSETEVAAMTDTFLALMLPGAGDELQGIKRGLMELADVLAVNKADGDTKPAALRAARDLRIALRMLHSGDARWIPPVLTCSGLTGEGVDDVWNAVLEHRAMLKAEGLLEKKRREQSEQWMWRLVDMGLRDAMRRDPRVRDLLGTLRGEVADGSTSPVTAARRLLSAFGI